MKKSLLLAAVLSVAVMANAQYAHKTGATQTKAVATQTLKDVKIAKGVAQQATGQSSYAARPKREVPANTPYYLRPKGTMYVNWNKEQSGFIMPFINTKPYDTVTWRNMSTAQGTPAWGYWLYSIEAGERDSLTSNDYDLTVKYGYEYEDAPYLTVGGKTYTLSGYRVNRTSGAIENSANSGVAAVPNSEEIYSDFETNMLASSHYYGSSNRFGTEAYGWIYYSGAPGPDYDPESSDPDRSGHWFGKNYGEWNVFGCGFEKPVSPYVLNNVYVWLTDLSVTEDCDLECRIYRLPDLPAYNDTASAAISGEYLNAEGNLIATGRTTITTDMNEEGGAFLEFTLYETDPDLGIEYETTPEINDAIAIVIVGMDQEAIQTCSALITTDEEDEGVGEVTFLGHQEDGTLMGLRGLNNFFTSGQLKAGSSILVDVTRPFITFNYTFETGEYTFPNNGGQVSHTVGGETYTGINFFAYSPSADWYLTLADGSDVPDWLTINLSDEYEDGEWAGTVQADVTCAALPAGLSGRTAVVRFAINGGYVDYTFIQGDGGPVNYNITIAEGIENGTIICEKQTAAEGEEVTFNVWADEGYEVEGVTVTAEGIDELIEVTEEAGVYSFVMPAANVTVNATFQEAETPGVRGDVDGNGIVDVNDVSIAIDIILGTQTDPTYMQRADVDGNGIVDVADVSDIIDIVLGKA